MYEQNTSMMNTPERNTFLLPAMVEGDFSSDEIAEDADGLQMMSFQRVKIPAGGALQFEIPTEDPDNPDYARTLEGVILYNHSAYTLWPEGSEYDEDTKPLCSSVDGKTGIGEPGGACATCPMNAYGSARDGGRGKACKNMRDIYLLRSGEYMPLLISLPPTSIKPFKEFLNRAFVYRRRATYGSLIQIGLKKENNGSNDYSVATFRLVRDFQGEELAQIRAYYDFRPEGGSIMGVLIKNEFYKLKREWFMVFLLLLSLLPILTGGAGAVFNNSTKSLADLFFFMNNQFSMFFPMVIFILIGSLFYQEYKNKTYINWITYGFSKKKLFLSKVAVSIVIGFGFAAVLFIAFGLLVAVLNGAGRLTGGVSLFLNLAIGFGIEAGVVVLITTCLGAIVINLSRNIIVTSVVGVIYGFASCLFIGSESGFIIPGSFAYRVSMFFSDKSTYYEAPVPATIGGCISIVLCLIVMFLVGLIVFSHKKKIEN